MVKSMIRRINTLLLNMNKSHAMFLNKKFNSNLGSKILPQENSAFRAFYDSELLPILKSLEVKRKNHLNVMIVSNLVTIVLCVLFFMVMPFNFILFVVSFILFTFVIVQINTGWSEPAKDKLRNQFKKAIVTKIVAFADGSLQYTHNRGISLVEFRQSRLFMDYVDRFASEDEFIGKVGRTQILFSEVHAEQKDSDVRKFNSWHSIFKGIYFIADFNKHFQGQTFVVTDRIERSSGIFNYLHKKFSLDGEFLVKLENPEFEKAFDVYSSDPVEAHYILSPALMWRILSLRNRAGGVQLSFIDSHVFIAIPFHRPFLEVPMSNFLSNYSRLESFIDDIQFAIRIVEELNLNTRIWTKE